MSPFSLPRGLGFRRLRLRRARRLRLARFFCRRSRCAGFAGLGLSRRSPFLPGPGSLLSLGGTVAGSRALPRRLSCLSLIGICGGRSGHCSGRKGEAGVLARCILNGRMMLSLPLGPRMCRRRASWDELSGMLEEKASAFFDALSRILGLDALTDAARRLQQARSGREGLTKESEKARKELAVRFVGQVELEGC